MRGLAEYAMSGRRQAILVAVLFGLIPLLYPLSGAFVALVVLRRGLQEGLVVLLWASLSAGLHWLAGGSSPLIVLVGVTALAVLLRNTGSWQKVLMAAMLLGLGLQLTLPLQIGYLAEFEAVIEQAINERMEAGQPLQVPEVTPEGTVMVNAQPEDVVALLTSFYGALHMLLFIAALAVARALQARLYNPGGFTQEFHGLRVNVLSMAALFGLVVAGLLGISPLSELLSLLCVIPILVGLAVIHAIVARLKLGRVWLFITYLGLMLMPPLIVLLGFTDSVLDYRNRVKIDSDLNKD